MRTLHGEGDLRPRASRIAERAGVSPRTVWQQFADMEALLFEASRRDLEILMTMLWPIDVGLPLDKRITRFVSRNTHIYERMTQGWRAARLHEPFSAELRRSKQQMTALGKAEIEAVFAPELRRLVGQRGGPADQRPDIDHPACVPIIVRAGGKQQRVHIGVGTACPGQRPAQAQSQG
jgi:AcrR family transcriptional regulator